MAVETHVAGVSILAENANAFPVLSKPFDPSLRPWLEVHVDRTAATRAD